MKDKNQNIKWYSLAIMAFSTVWGFGNVVNGFVYFDGPRVIFSWILMFLLYFIPYALMVGELGSVFKNQGSGVSSWILETIGPKAAFYAGWTYWACHITYIAGKGSGALKALSWAIFRNAEYYDSLPTYIIQGATLLIFIAACIIASKGINPLKLLMNIAGTSMFVMSLLYVAMMFAAPAINPSADYVSMDLSIQNLIPNFNVAYFTSLSILVFAVGGCEKISPYVNKVENPSKGFPKGIITMALMVLVCAILGTFAMGRMFDPAVINESQESFNSYAANGCYWAFQKLGEYYHLGDFLMIVFAICNFICQIAILILSIDAPLRMLLGNEETKEFIPSRLLKQNEKGVYINGVKLVGILSGLLILVQIIMPGAASILQQLNKLNSVCMPLRYLWVFVAYLAMRRKIDNFPSDYRFVKKQRLAKFVGAWCLIVTFGSCVVGMYSSDTVTLILNILTPLILTSLGLIMPIIAKREKDKGLR